MLYGCGLLKIAEPELNNWLFLSPYCLSFWKMNRNSLDICVNEKKISKPKVNLIVVVSVR